MSTPGLMPHQSDAVRRLDNGKILCGGVGTGKTRVAMQYYVEKESPRDIVVLTTAKKRDEFDWIEEAHSYGIGTELSQMGRGTITVDSWNNIGKYLARTDCFFIFDEQRVVGSGAWVKSFYAICKRNRWILLSATPGDTWLDYIPVFVANGFYKNAAQFKREHVIYSFYGNYPKVERFVSPGRLVRYRNELLVDMPYERHTKRHLVKYEVAHDEELYTKTDKTRWNPYTDEPIVDAGEYHRVMRRIVNSDPSRIASTLKLLGKHPKIILFYNFDYELEELRKLGNCPFVAVKTCTCKGLVVCEYNGHKHEEIPEADHWLYIVQYQSGAEGWNCIETDAMIFYSLTYSYRNFEQSQGRTDRLNTPFTDLWYYIFQSKTPIDSNIRRSLTGKQNFNERKSGMF